MKYLALYIICFSIYGCQVSDEKAKDEFEFTYDDSIKAAQIEQRLLKEALEEKATKSVFDTVGLYLAPLKITSARLVKRDYTSYRDIFLSYKNISQKRISAIRFRWYGVNAFNEPAEMGEYGMLIGFGSGFTDDPLNPGKSASGTWEIMSRNAKKVLLAWPHEVVFTDGTKWQLK